MIIPCPIVARTAINGDAQDALAFFQAIETRVNESVAVELARGFHFCQLLGFVKRDVVEFLFALGCRNVDGVGDTVTYWHQIVTIITAGTGIYAQIR